MNRNLSLVLVVIAAVCGLAFAAVPKHADGALQAVASNQSEAPQLAALQKRVEALEAELVALKKVKPTDPEAALAKNREMLEGVVHYLRAQSGAAGRLQAVLEDSREKGFTFGINPDSRTVLLQGFHEFAESIKTDLPGEPAIVVELPVTPKR